MKSLENIAGLQEMNIKEMNEVNGGWTRRQALATINVIAGIGSCFGPVGLAICGPTAIGLAIGEAICAYRD
nr:hypothetical protein [uncultured Bacteroides sp.]